MESWVQVWFLHALHCKDILVLSYLHFSYSEQKNCSLYICRGLSKLCNDFNDQAVKHNIIKKGIIINLLWKEKFAFFVLLKLGSCKHLALYVEIFTLYIKNILKSHIKLKEKNWNAISDVLFYLTSKLLEKI